MKKFLSVFILISLLAFSVYGADVKISELPEATTKTSDDLLMIVDSPGSSPVNKKITVGNISPWLEVDGSAAANLTAAQVSNTVITNLGQAAADVLLTLPVAAAGYSFLASAGTTQASNSWGVKANTNDKIYLIGSDETITAGSDNASVILSNVQAGQAFTCWTFKTGASSYDWACKATAGTITVAGIIYTDCSNIGAGNSFYWNGDHASGSGYGCKDASTSLNANAATGTAVVSGTDPAGKVSPLSGGNVIKLDASNEELTWPITGKDIYDSAEALITMSYYAATTTDENRIFTAYVDANNTAKAWLNADNTVFLQVNGQGSYINCTSTDQLTDAEWTTIQFRWKISANATGIKIGAGDWKACTGTLNTFASEPPNFSLGSATITNVTYIDNLFISKTSGL